MIFITCLCLPNKLSWSAQTRIWNVSFNSNPLRFSLTFLLTYKAKVKSNSNKTSPFSKVNNKAFKWILSRQETCKGSKYVRTPIYVQAHRVVLRLLQIFVIYYKFQSSDIKFQQGRVPCPCDKQPRWRTRVSDEHNYNISNIYENINLHFSLIHSNMSGQKHSNPGVLASLRNDY